MQEAEKEDIFPINEDKMPGEAKRFVNRLDKARMTVDALTEEVKAECQKFSQDVKFWAEFQTGVKEFEPWVRKAEVRKKEGLKKPMTLVEACQVLGESKNFQVHVHCRAVHSRLENQRFASCNFSGFEI